jgi:hypothetical protein
MQDTQAGGVTVTVSVEVSRRVNVRVSTLAAAVEGTSVGSRKRVLKVDSVTVTVEGQASKVVVSTGGVTLTEGESVGGGGASVVNVNVVGTNVSVGGGGRSSNTTVKLVSARRTANPGGRSAKGVPKNSGENAVWVQADSW